MPLSDIGRPLAFLVLLAVMAGKPTATAIEEITQAALASEERIGTHIRLEHLRLYRYIGESVLINQHIEPHFSQNLSTALAKTLPQSKSFSRKSLNNMALFAAEYREDELEHSGLNLVSWGHVVLLIHLVPNKNARAILAKKSATNNWDAGQLWAEINKSFDESKRPPKNSFP